MLIKCGKGKGSFNKNILGIGQYHLKRTTDSCYKLVSCLQQAMERFSVSEFVKKASFCLGQGLGYMLFFGIQLKNRPVIFHMHFEYVPCSSIKIANFMHPTIDFQ